MRHRLRDRRASTDRQDRRWHQPGRERPVLPDAGRLPRRQRLPAEAGHGQGPGARRAATRPTTPARSTSACRRPRTRPTSPSPRPRSSGSRKPAFDSVQIDQIDQGNYILTALQGNFQVFQWRNHGGLDLDQQYIWWHSSNALPVGQLALNFGRIKDPVIDKAARRRTGRDRPGQEEGARRDGQQAVRRAVLQHLGRLRPLGSASHAGRAGSRGLHGAFRREGVPLQRHRRRLQRPVGLDQAVAARDARRASRSRRPPCRVASAFTGLQCARIDTVATAVVGSAWRYMWRGSQAAALCEGVIAARSDRWQHRFGRRTAGEGPAFQWGRFFATTDNDQTPHGDAAGRSRPRSRPRRRGLRQ